MVVIQVCGPTGWASSLDIAELRDALNRADAECVKECLKTGVSDAMNFQEVLFGCVKGCPSIKKSAIAQASRGLGIASGVIGVVRLIPKPIRCCRDVPLCVAWARDPRIARCWGTIATSINSVLACVSFSLNFVPGDILDWFGLMVGSISSCWGVAQLGLDIWDLRYVFSSVTTKKAMLENVLQKMEDSLGIGEEVQPGSQNSFFVNLEHYNSLVAEWQTVGVENENIQMRMNNVRNYLQNWLGRES